jgi:GTPase SAR1 family protein
MRSGVSKGVFPSWKKAVEKSLAEWDFDCVDRCDDKASRVGVMQKVLSMFKRKKARVNVAVVGIAGGGKSTILHKLFTGMVFVSQETPVKLRYEIEYKTVEFRMVEGDMASLSASDWNQVHGVILG